MMCFTYTVHVALIMRAMGQWLNRVLRHIGNISAISWQDGAIIKLGSCFTLYTVIMLINSFIHQVFIIIFSNRALFCNLSGILMEAFKCTIHTCLHVNVYSCTCTCTCMNFLIGWSSTSIFYQLMILRIDYGVILFVLTKCWNFLT